MTLKAWLQRIFSPPNTNGETELGDESTSIEWTQNLRIVIAIIIVVASGFIVRWIVS